MAFSKMINPKKKRKVRMNTESPFPVPIATQQHQNEWFYYTGYLHDNHVEVKHSGDIDRLYKMGFFGKGMLSRSKPEFNQNYRWVDIPNCKGEIIHARVMSRRSYIHRRNWQLNKDHKTEQHIEYDSAEELWEDTADIETLNKDGQNTYIHVEDTGNAERSNNTSTDILSGTENLNEQCKQSACSWETSVKGSDEESWEEDADFWDIKSCDKSKEQKESEKNLLQDSCDIWTCDEQNKSKLEDGIPLENQTALPVKQNFKNVETVVKQFDSDDLEKKSLSKPKLTKEFDKKHSISLQQTKDPSKELEGDPSNPIVSSMEGGVVNKKCTKNDEHEKCSDIIIDNQNDTKSRQEISTTEYTLMEVDINKAGGISTDLSQNADKIYEDTAGSDIDSLCKSDHEDGQLFVVEDSDSDVERSKRRKVTRKKWRPVLKRDPFYIHENLHLSYEEAFFLSYGLGCLLIKDEDGRKPDLTEMWQLFSRRQKTFLPNYIAYHYYRSKGWVPKTGLKFGTDFLIYKEGPAFYHGSYSVIVKMVTKETMTEDLSYNTREFTWTSMAGLNRLTEQVAKEVLVCYVIKPDNLTSEDLLSPKCIPLFHVKEILLSRWVSSQEREKKSDDIP